MRGSPFLRFILLAIALAATAVGLQRVTSTRVKTPPPLHEEIRTTSSLTVPYRLMLSAPASSIEIETGRTSHPEPTDMPISGTLEIDPENPHLALVVHWKNPVSSGEHRFAKLTLEPPGLETYIHVFDADGDIDDFIELPFPAAK